MPEEQTLMPRSSRRAPLGSKTPARAPSLCRVRLEFLDGAARKVCIAGGFNGWRPDVTEMLPMGGGKWAVELMLTPGRYQYQFVVDGEWMVDPNARESVPNPFGGRDSLLPVGEAS